MCLLDINSELSNKMKGFAILTVLLAHLKGAIYLSGVARLIIDSLCNVGMSGFLFLSGYGLYCSYRKDNSFTNYWNKRISKVLIPAIIVELITAIFYGILNKDIMNRTFVYNAITLNETSILNAPIWYVKFIFIWYFFFYIVYKYLTKYLKKSIYINILWIIIGLVVWYFVPEIFGPAGVYCWSFILGLYCAQIKIKNSSKYKYINIVILLIGILASVIIQNNIDKFYSISGGYWIYSALLNVIYFITMYSIMLFLNMFKFEGFIKLGNLSFYIYLLHMPIYLILVSSLKNTNVVFLYVLAIILTMVCSNIIYMRKR